MKYQTIFSISCVTLLLSSCVPQTATPQTAFLASNATHYKALGIKQNTVEAWEDGRRTNGQEGSYEWWYNDAKFDDGTTVVVVFYSKKGFDVEGPARPTASIDITFPSGKKFSREIYEEGKVIDAKQDIADVRIKDSYLKYEDGNYKIKFSHKDVTYQATMTSNQPMYRPNTGHMYFGNEKKDFFAWLVAQPSAKVEATLNIKGQSAELKGHGYHDHNWGNVAMNKLMNHWYWGRVNIGGYDIIASDIIAEEKYGYSRIPLMFIAKNNKVIKHDLNSIKVERSKTTQHPFTQKFIDNHLTYRQTDVNGIEYKVEFLRKKDITQVKMIDRLPWFEKSLAKLAGANPTYLRILGDVRLTVNDGKNIQVFEEEGLWEQMFFGNNKTAIINNRR